MTILVAGNAALLDFVARADRVPGPSDVASLIDGPGAQGEWTYGGAAPIAALQLGRNGHAVRLWHPLPQDPRLDDMLADLKGAGVDLARCPRVPGPAPCCVLIGSESGRLAWSGRLTAPEIDRPADILRGVEAVLFAPVWGAWADALLDEAIATGIPCSLFGAALPDRPGQRWDMFVADERQHLGSGVADARISCVTLGERGARILHDGGTINVPAAPAQVVDTTGAGDTFAAAFVGAVRSGTTIEAAAAQASASAARACEHWGGWPRKGR